MNNPDYEERACSICGWEYKVHFATPDPLICPNCREDEPPDWVRDEER